MSIVPCPCVVKFRDAVLESGDVLTTAPSGMVMLLVGCWYV